MIETILWLSLTIYHEARNQEPLDQMAVAYVILNRAKNSTVKEVVLADKQFSCYNSGIQMPLDFKALATSVQISVTALSGRDFTQGSTHYHKKSIKPYWRHKVTFVGQYGDHLFYKKLVKIKAERRKIVHENKIANSSSIGKHWGRRG